jgi:hypothetical protein
MNIGFEPYSIYIYIYNLVLSEGKCNINIKMPVHSEGRSPIVQTCFLSSALLPKNLLKVGSTLAPGYPSGWYTFRIWTPILLPISIYKCLQIPDRSNPCRIRLCSACMLRSFAMAELSGAPSILME